MAHFDSLLPLSRRDLEFIWLLTAGWDEVGLRPASLPTKRLFLLDTVGDPSQRLAVQLGANAAGYQVIDVPAALPADRILPVVGEVADVFAVADDGDRSDAILRQDQVPVVVVQRGGGGPLHVLGHLFRWYMAGHPLRGLRVVWEGAPTATLTSWCEATGAIPLQVTQVGERDHVDPALLARLAGEGQQGQFRRLRTVPVHDVEASEPLGVRTLACTIAAVLDHTQQ